MTEIKERKMENKGKYKLENLFLKEKSNKTEIKILLNKNKYIHILSLDSDVFIILNIIITTIIF